MVIYMDKKKKFKYMFMVWIAILVIAVVRKTLQNDTFYTIKIGELIINNGRYDGSFFISYGTSLYISTLVI